MKKQFAKLPVAICVTLLVSGCSNFLARSDEPSSRVVERSADIADVFVTALPPMAFGDLQGSLAIHHDLSAADCRALAAQTTRSDVYQLLSQVAFGIGLSLPLHTVANAVTTSNGVTSTTNTATTGSAVVPVSSGVASNTASLSPDIAKSATSLGLDGEAAIMGGTALCQSAVLTQQQIASAKLPDGYDANVITFQVNVQPKARDLSYDTTIGLELWPEEQSPVEDGMPPVLVYPLIINDVLESASTARSTEVIRQFSASLSGVLGNLVATNIGGGSGLAEQNTALGVDRNGILTMGRVNGNTIQIRIGAPSAGTARYAMVPRTFNVSALVLTKKASSSNATGMTRLTAISRSNFVHTDPKVHLPSDIAAEPSKILENRIKQAEKVVQVMNGYDELKLSDKEFCGGKYMEAYRASKIDKDNMLPLLDLLRQMNRQELGYLKICVVPSKPIQEPSSCDDNCKQEIRERLELEEISRIRFYSDLAKVNVGSRYSTNIIPIPTDKPAKLPKADNQLIVIEDDGKTASTVLRGGEHLKDKSLIAYAIVDSSFCDQQRRLSECRLPASGVSVSSDGSVVTVTLPSLLMLKLPHPKFIVLADIKQQSKQFTNCEDKENVACFTGMLFATDKKG